MVIFKNQLMLVSMIENSIFYLVHDDCLYIHLYTISGNLQQSAFSAAVSGRGIQKYLCIYMQIYRSQYHNTCVLYT